MLAIIVGKTTSNVLVFSGFHFYVKVRDVHKKSVGLTVIPVC